MKYFFISIYFFLFVNSLSFAQQVLTGRVTSEKDSSFMVGATIYIPDLKLGTITNSEGTYTMHNVPNGTYLIQVSYIGFESVNREITIKESAKEDFVLKESHSEISEVIVTGVSSATDKHTDPVPVSVATQKDFMQSSATNIIDAITNKVPGVSGITEGPAISKPVIRGLGYNRVIILNDGVRQEGQQWGDEFGIEVDEYSVNKVEVLKGPASLSYGSDAMAGVINMLAAPPLPEGKVKATIVSNYQSNNGLFAESFNLAGNKRGIVYDFRYTNKLAHAYRNKYDGYVWNSGYGENDFKGMVGINRKWGYSHLTVSFFDLMLGIVEGARDSITGKFTKHVLSSMGEDSAAIVSDKESKEYNHYPIVHQNVIHQKMVWDNNIIIGKGRLGIRLGVQRNYRKEANDITIGDIYNNYFYLQTLNYYLQYILPEKNHWQISVGANGMQQTSQDRGTVFLVPEYNLFDVGIFSIIKKTFNKLAISGGWRYDTRILHAKSLFVNSNGARLTDARENSVERFSAYNSNFSGYSGSIGATYDFSNYFYVKANISRGFRAPNIAENGSNGIHDGTPFYEIGDPKLKPESSLQFDATLGVNNENVSAELNTFVNEINNYIFPVKLASTSGGDSIRTDNVAGMSGPAFKYISGNAILSGGEAVLTLHPKAIKWVELHNTFSMVNAIQKNQSDSTKYLPYTPPYKFTSELKFTFSKTNNTFKNCYFKIGLNYFFEQDKIYYKFGNETPTPAYTLLNAGLGTDIVSQGKTIFSVFIYGNNLANVAYQSNMSRLKYSDINYATGRMGIYNMGRNFSFKVVIPIWVKGS